MAAHHHPRASGGIHTAQFHLSTKRCSGAYHQNAKWASESGRSHCVTIWTDREANENLESAVFLRDLHPDCPLLPPPL